VLIQFIQGSTDGWDAMYDLEKRWGYDEAPQLYSIIGENEYFSVNALPGIEENMIVPIGLKVGLEAEYVITPIEFENFKASQVVIIEDLKTNSFETLDFNSEYRFDASPLDPEHRFNLHFKSSTFGTDENSGQLVKVYSNEKTVYVQTREYAYAEVDVFDMMGRKIASEKTHGDIVSKIKLNVETGYYLVQVQTNDQFITRKVFIK
jgi:hypothetical protein